MKLNAVVEPGEYLLTLPGDDGVVIYWCSLSSSPNRVQPRPVHQVGLLHSSTLLPLTELFTHHHTPTLGQAMLVQLAGHHILQPVVVGGWCLQPLASWK